VIQQLADHVPALIAYLERNERYRFANKHYEHRYGFPPERLIGRHVSEIIGQEAYTRGADLAHRVLWQGEQICFENSVVSITGHRHHLQVNMIPHKSWDGQVLGMFVLALDITPLKQVEATLRHKEALLQKALQAAQMSAWEWDLQTDQERWWPEIEHLGSTGSHRDFLLRVHPEDRERVMQAQMEAIQSCLPYQAEFRVVSSEGRVAWKSSQGTLLLNEKGKPVRMVGISADVTEQKQAEQALKEAVAAADAANRAKSSFLANMTHELRTPMNAILGFCQLLSRDENLTPQQQQSLRVIGRSGEHLLNQINAVLDISKIEAGRITLQEHPCDLWELLAELQDLFEPRIQAKLLQFQLIIAPEVPQIVVVDETKLRQALCNLLANALKFTHQGKITLAVSVEVQGQARYLCLVVQDTGEGISIDEIPQLFQPFVQSSSGIRSQQGTGLGLCISQQYIHLMGGSIAVTSQLGLGSSFIVQIPCQPSRANLAPEDPMKVPSNLMSSSPSPSTDLSQRLAHHPLRWRQELFQAALQLDSDRVLQCIHTLTEEDADLAQILIQWVEDFRFDHLTDLLQPPPHD
jgi:PAS domain S-box-containing protein